MKLQRSGSNSIVSFLVFFCVVAAFFFLLIIGITPDTKEISTPAEIAEMDLSVDSAHIQLDSGEWYPGELYVPSDFTNEIGRASCRERV